jgi:hypothetical protein
MRAVGQRRGRKRQIADRDDPFSARVAFTQVGDRRVARTATTTADRPMTMGVSKAYSVWKAEFGTGR